MSYDIQAQLSQTIKNLQKKGTDQSLGFPHLERFFDNRGFPDGSTTFLIGKSKVGKTSLIINSMVSLASRNVKTLFFSLEMSAPSVLVKFARLVLQKHPWRIRELIQQDKENIEYLRNKMKSRGLMNNLKIIDGSEDNMRISASYIHKAIEEYNPKVVFIDHLHLIKSANSGDIFAHTTANANAIVSIGKLTGAIMFSLVQISRGDSGTKASDGSVLPTMSGAKGSGAVEEAGDCIIGIARPDISPAVDPSMRGKIIIGILGNRFGESSPPLTYYYDSDSTNLTFEDEYMDEGLNGQSG